MNKQIIRRKQSFCNMNLCNNARFVGDYDIPYLSPFEGDVPESFIPFNMAMSSKNYACGVHFYIDDYQFERLWNNPEKYLPILRRFQCVISPDYSMFVDAPKIVNIWNVYRNRLISHWLQQNDIKVIPSVSWGNVESFSYCFDGLPRNSIISVGHSAKGKNISQLSLWKYGLNEVLTKLEPSTLLIYGYSVTIENQNVINIKDYISKLKQYDGRKKARIL